MKKDDIDVKRQREDKANPDRLWWARKDKGR
jgi:hypothetical protein